MSWLPQGSMAGVFVAIESGLYAKHGLEVEALRGFGGIRTVNELDQGLFEFAYADPLAIALNRANGGHARLVAALNQRWPAGLCFDASRHALRTPADLGGLTLGGGQNSPMQVIVPVWLRNNGVDPASVKLLQLDPSVVAASVLEAKIDAGECWLGNSVPVYRKRATEAGVALGMLEYAAFGLDMYGAGIATTDALIESEPATVAAFVTATLEGYALALQKPDEAVAMMLRHHPLLDPAITRAQLDETAALLGDASLRGRIDPARVERSLGFLDAAYALTGKVTAADLYTTRFVAVAQEVGDER
jgi:NitT/TauT family transport system substrate-binding protein